MAEKETVEKKENFKEIQDILTELKLFRQDKPCPCGEGVFQFTGKQEGELYYHNCGSKECKNKEILLDKKYPYNVTRIVELH